MIKFIDILKEYSYGGYYDEDEARRKAEAYFDTIMEYADINDVIEGMKESEESYPGTYPEGYFDNPELAKNVKDAMEYILLNVDGDNKHDVSFDRLAKSNRNLAKSFLKSIGLTDKKAIDDAYEAISNEIFNVRDKYL